MKSAIELIIGRLGVQAVIGEPRGHGAAFDHEGLKATKGSSPNEHASHSASEETDIEVDEEADCVTADFEVGEKLGAVNGRQLINRLDLDHD